MVVVPGRQRIACARFGIESFANRVVRQETGSQQNERLFHSITQALPDTRALVESVLVILLDETGSGGSLCGRKARGVKQTEKHGEIGKYVFVEHAFEIELNEALADQSG